MNRLQIDGIHYADSTFFDVFSFKIIEGNSFEILTKPNTIVLTKETANILFGSEKALGQSIVSEGIAYTVSGIVENPPASSTIQFKMLEPMATLYVDGKSLSWGHGLAYETWLLLKPETNIVKLEKSINLLMDQTVNQVFKSINASIEGFLEPIEKIYLNSKVERQLVQGDKKAISIFAATAILILVIACFNFVNLSTAKALQRAKEVGMRKVCGATKKQLVIQYLGESLLLVVIATLLAILLTELASPLLEKFVNKNISIYSDNSQFLVLAIPAIVFITGIGAGWYPAIYLSKLSPQSALKQASRKIGGKSTIRNLLVFLQFAILQTLAVCSFIVYAQLQNIKQKDLGFMPENVLLVNANSPSVSSKHELLKQKFVEHSSIDNASAHSFVLGQSILTRDFVLENNSEAQLIPYMTIDESFFDTYGIELLEGRNFHQPLENEGLSLIVNEKFVDHFSYTNPIGRKIFLPNDPNHRENIIISVVKNFNFFSLHRSVEPMVMMTWHDPFSYISIKLNSDNSFTALTQIKEVWSNIAPDVPLNYNFMSDKLATLYSKDIRFGSILGVFTLLAIVIACSGLFGLASHTAQSRQKEVAVRKVLGSTTRNLVALLSLGFAKWVIAASIIAWPTSWYIANVWLNNFANRIDTPYWNKCRIFLINIKKFFSVNIEKTFWCPFIISISQKENCISRSIFIQYIFLIFTMCFFGTC